MLDILNIVLTCLFGSMMTCCVVCITCLKD